MQAFADHGEVAGDTVTGTAAQAQEVFDALERARHRPGRRVPRAGDRGRREVRASPGTSCVGDASTGASSTAPRARRCPAGKRDGRASRRRQDRGHDRRQGANPLRDPRDKRLPRIAGPCGLVIFGVTGDLSRKKLMPAIYDLANRGLLPPGFALVGFARRDWDDRTSPRSCTTR